MKRIRTIVVVGLGATLLAAVGIAERFPSVTVPRDIGTHGSWVWDSAVDADQGVMPWSVQLTRDANNRISGRIAVAGLPLFKEGNLDGEITLPWVRGVVSDDDGNEFGRFEGTVGAAGIDGSFVTVDGEVGAWAWTWPALR